MISFECDYNNGAHPKVLENLIKYNGAKPTPYGFDEFSERAKERIREAIGMPDSQIFFLTGGTQANATTIDSMLYQYEGVICVTMPTPSIPVWSTSPFPRSWGLSILLKS